MSDTARETKAVMTSDGRLLIEQPDGSYRPAPAGRTDWARVDAMTDDEITANALADPDAQPLDDECWRTAEILKPPAVGEWHTGLRIDADVLDWFKAQGRGWQTRINARAADLLRAPAQQGAAAGVRSARLRHGHRARHG